MKNDALYLRSQDETESIYVSPFNRRFDVVRGIKQKASRPVIEGIFIVSVSLYLIPSQEQSAGA